MNDPRNLDSPSALVRDDETLDGGAILRLLDRPLSADDLHQATERVARPLQPPEKEVVRLLLFRVADELLALEAVNVAQVTNSHPVRRIPHRTNKIIRGLCGVDGDLLLCADLARLLGLPAATGHQEETNHERRMIVAGEEAARWVTEVDQVRGVVAVVPDTFKQPPITVDAALGRYTQSLVPVGREMAALVNFERLTTGFQAALS